MNKEDIQRWQVLILGIMMCGGTDFLDRLFEKDAHIKAIEEYERMKSE